MATTTRSKHFAASADEMWKRVGGFGTLHEWHPAVASVKTSEDGSQRDCTLQDGAILHERLVSQDENSYTYAFDESALPLKNYESTIRVRKDGAGSVVEWDGNFEPAGISETQAVELVGGLYQAGLDAL